MSRSGSKSAKWLAVALVGLLLTPALAAAEALVVVKLKDGSGKPADGEVTLRSKDGNVVSSCATSGGTCEMAKVPGGNYVVTVKPKKGSAPKPKPVMIPPAGKVDLHVTTG